MHHLWTSLPSFLRETLKVLVLTTVLGMAGWWGARSAVETTIKEDWFRDKVIKELNKNIVGMAYQTNIYFGRPKDTLEYSLQIYSSEKQPVELYLKAHQFGNDPLRQVEILVDGVPVPGINIGKASEYKKIIDLTPSVSGARSRAEHDFSQNIQTITFRTPDNQKTKNYVFIEALITTIGISKRYNGEDQ